VSRLNKKGVFRVKTESGCQEKQLVAFEIRIHHSETRALIKRTDTNAGHFASCRRHPQTMPKAGSVYLAPPLLRSSAPPLLRAFPIQKANDHSLLELHEEW
jgi:hypothetical protein